MSRLLGAGVIALWLCVACDAGSPRAGTPGLEPPRSTDDSVVPPPASTAGMTAPAGGGGGGAGNVAGAAGSGTTGSGSLPLGGAGGASASAGSTSEPVDMTMDGGLLPDAGGTTFSTLHAAELMKDCQETIACFLQRDEQLEADPLAACLEDSAVVLDSGDAEAQARFLANFERCKAFIVCDYYDCATSGL